MEDISQQSVGSQKQHQSKTLVPPTMKYSKANRVARANANGNGEGFAIARAVSNCVVEAHLDGIGNEKSRLVAKILKKKKKKTSKIPKPNKVTSI